MATIIKKSANMPLDKTSHLPSLLNKVRRCIHDSQEHVLKMFRPQIHTCDHFETVWTPHYTVSSSACQLASCDIVSGKEVMTLAVQCLCDPHDSDKYE